VTRDVVISVLVGLGVTGELLCCAGLVLMRTVYDRLHYAMAATSVPPFFIAAAVLVEEGWTQPGINALLVAAAMLLASPPLSIGIARAARDERG
jgi:multisubunit Na+/H+ antiporter MnhG subunit